MATTKELSLFERQTELCQILKLEPDAGSNWAQEEELTPQQRDLTALAVCHIDYSSAFHHFAFAHGDTIVTTTGVDDDFQVQHVFEDTGVYNTTSKEGLTSSHDATVTAIKFIDLPALSAPLLVAGYSSGHVRLFSKDVLLVAQQFHSTAVVDITTQPRTACPDIVALYEHLMVIVDGAAVMRGVAGSTATANGSGGVDLKCKKWDMRDQRCRSVACLGNRVPGAYDHLVSPSRSGDVMEPAFQYIVAGHHPMLAVYSTAGVDRPFLSVANLATQVATNFSKAVVSMVSSFWGSSPSSSSSASSSASSFKAQGTLASQGSALLQPGSPLPMAFSLSDPRREVTSLALSPNGAFAAVTDALGRVLLMNVHLSIVVRVWKGYRDARCFWVTTEPPLRSDTAAPAGTSSIDASRQPQQQQQQQQQQRGGRQHGALATGAHQLCIYARRRGLLEVWNVPLGSRAAAFNIGIGSIVVPCVYSSSARNVMIVRTSGCVHTLHLPYACALSDTASSHLKQQHALTAFVSYLDSLNPDTTEELSLPHVNSLLSQLTSCQFLQQALDAAFEDRSLALPVVQQLITAVLDKASDALDKSSAQASTKEAGGGGSTEDVDALELSMWHDLRARQLAAYKALRSLLSSDHSPAHTTAAPADNAHLVSSSDGAAAIAARCVVQSTGMDAMTRGAEKANWDHEEGEGEEEGEERKEQKDDEGEDGSSDGTPECGGAGGQGDDRIPVSQLTAREIMSRVLLAFAHTEAATNHHNQHQHQDQGNDHDGGHGAHDKQGERREVERAFGEEVSTAIRAAAVSLGTFAGVLLPTNAPKTPQQLHALARGAHPRPLFGVDASSMDGERKQAARLAFASLQQQHETTGTSDPAAVADVLADLGLCLQAAVHLWALWALQLPLRTLLSSSGANTVIGALHALIARLCTPAAAATAPPPPQPQPRHRQQDNDDDGQELGERTPAHAKGSGASSAPTRYTGSSGSGIAGFGGLSASTISNTIDVVLASESSDAHKVVALSVLHISAATSSTPTTHDEDERLGATALLRAACRRHTSAVIVTTAAHLLDDSAHCTAPRCTGRPILDLAAVFADMGATPALFARWPLDTTAHEEDMLFMRCNSEQGIHTHNTHASKAQSRDTGTTQSGGSDDAGNTALLAVLCRASELVTAAAAARTVAGEGVEEGGTAEESSALAGASMQLTDDDDQNSPSLWLTACAVVHAQRWLSEPASSHRLAQTSAFVAALGCWGNCVGESEGNDDRTGDSGGSRSGGGGVGGGSGGGGGVLQAAVVLQLWRKGGKAFAAELTAQNEKVKKFVKERLCVKHLNMPAAAVTQATLVLCHLLLTLLPDVEPASVPFFSSLAPLVSWLDTREGEDHADSSWSGKGGVVAGGCNATAAAVATSTASASAPAPASATSGSGSGTVPPSTGHRPAASGEENAHGERAIAQAAAIAAWLNTRVGAAGSGRTSGATGAAGQKAWPQLQLQAPRSRVLVECHAALLLALHMIMRFQLKARALSTLFGEERRAAIFSPLHHTLHHHPTTTTALARTDLHHDEGHDHCDDDDEDAVCPDPPPDRDTADGVIAAQQQFVCQCLAGIMRGEGGKSRRGKGKKAKQSDEGHNSGGRAEEGKDHDDASSSPSSSMLQHTRQRLVTSLLSQLSLLYCVLLKGDAAWLEAQVCVAHVAAGNDAAAQDILHTLNPTRGFVLDMVQVCRGRAAALLQDRASAAVVTVLSHLPHEVEQWLAGVPTSTLPPHMQVDAEQLAPLHLGVEEARQVAITTYELLADKQGEGSNGSGDEGDGGQSKRSMEVGEWQMVSAEDVKRTLQLLSSLIDALSAK